MSSLSGAFSAANEVSGALLLKPGQQATYTLTEDDATTWAISAESSTNPTSTWNIVTTHANDDVASTTLTNQTGIDQYYRLRCSSTNGGVDWTLADVSGETQQTFENKQTGVTEIIYTDQGVKILRNLEVVGSLSSGSGGSTLILPGDAAPSQTAEGSTVWDTNDDLLTVGTGSSRKTMLDTNSSQTATNKTFTTPILTTPVINGALTGTGTVGKSRYYAGIAQVGAGAGFTLSTGTNVGRLATVSASQTAATLVVRFSGLAVSDTITGFYLLGQIESAGNTVTVNCALRKLTAAAADLTDAAVESMTQLSVTADTVMNNTNTTKTLVTPLAIASDVTHYLLITVTTGASCDVDLMAACLVVTHALFNSGE